MTTFKPLTDEQRNAFPGLRAWLANMTFPLGIAESLKERARQPEPGSLPADVTVRVEISPPSRPPPLLDTSTLKMPEPVPLYFFTLRSGHEDQAQSPSDFLDQDTHVIFFIHGGGNITGHPTQAPFMNLFVQILRSVASHSHAENGIRTAKCKWVVVAPSYRVATVPENAFPAALQDLVAAYDYVLGKGYDASNIVVAGDSAGGNHAIILTHLILHSDRPAPRGVVAIAPAAMQTPELNEDARVRLRADIVNVAMCETMGRAYIGGSGVAPTDPLVSAALLTFTAAWPRTLILVGSADLLIDASRELARRIGAAGALVELVEYEERPHGWWVLPSVFPEELQDATGRVAQFVLDPKSASPRPIKTRL
ncbi:Alpha/Beta hydrolase protein [Chiua virens]|nr:Alpha/Beta hydrolase protein [Chiua virens]